MDIQRIGLIAGNGQFPILFARAAKDQGIDVAAVGIKGDTSILLRLFVEKFVWVKVGELEKLFTYFNNQGIKKIIMAGQVNPKNLFDQSIQLDDEFKQLFEALQDRKADTIFSAIADKLKEHGLELVDSTLLLDHFLSPRGTLTKRGPSIEELQDIEFGKNIAKTMGSIDVGQTVVIHNKAIVAIEAMEGTDKCILRGSHIARNGAVIIKMSKPNQDQRFDVPVIGPRTLKTMIKGKASCLAIEAEKTLIIDRKECIRLANKAGICIVAS